MRRILLALHVVAVVSAFGHYGLAITFRDGVDANIGAWWLARRRRRV